MSTKGNFAVDQYPLLYKVADNLELDLTFKSRRNYSIVKVMLIYVRVNKESSWQISWQKIKLQIKIDFQTCLPKSTNICLKTSYYLHQDSAKFIDAWKALQITWLLI